MNARKATGPGERSNGNTSGDCRWPAMHHGPRPSARLSRMIQRETLLQASVEFGESHERENATTGLLRLMLAKRPSPIAAPPPTSTGPRARLRASNAPSSAPSPRPVGSRGKNSPTRAVVRLIKRAAAAAGLDGEKYSGHSLRRGLMRQSRHRSAQSVLGYIEAADLWPNNVTEEVFRRGMADQKA
jgi:hypothetical protein